MTIVEMGAHIDAMKAAYPYAWPKVATQDEAKRQLQGIITVWFASFQHVSNELFLAALIRLIQDYERPSINTMWDAILDTAGVPRLHEMRACYRRMQERWYDQKLAVLEIEKHPIIRRTLTELGDKLDIGAMKPESADFKLREIFKESRRAYRAKFIQPQGIATLEAAYKKTLQLTDGKTGQIAG